MSKVIGFITFCCQGKKIRTGNLALLSIRETLPNTRRGHNSLPSSWSSSEKEKKNEASWPTQNETSKGALKLSSSSQFKWLHLLHYLAHLRDYAKSYTPGIEDTTQKVAGWEFGISEDHWIIGVRGNLSFLSATDLGEVIGQGHLGFLSSGRGPHMEPWQSLLSSDGSLEPEEAKHKTSKSKGDPKGSTGWMVSNLLQQPSQHELEPVPRPKQTHTIKMQDSTLWKVTLTRLTSLQIFAFTGRRWDLSYPRLPAEWLPGCCKSESRKGG